jgi:8-oxo-dGTP pyrophosphatase MutT (NUDIX family)
MQEIAAIIIRNSSGKFFAHRRAADRKTYPNLFGLGAGGKIEANESPKAAAARELFEETKIKAEPKFLFSLDYRDQTASRKIHVFEILTDQEPDWDKREWQSAGWFEPSAIAAMEKRGELCPDTAQFYRKYREKSLS